MGEMEGIELTDFTVRDVLPDKVLYNEVLCVLISNRFKKLQVTLTQFGKEDDDPAEFELNIQGLGHKFDLKFPFFAKDLCFLHREELCEDVKDSCLSCLDRNFYKSSVCTRLTLLWRLVDLEGDNGGDCVKIPFVQHGNRHAATRLQKLESVIYNHVAKPADLKHWHVHVKKCGSFPEGLPMFLGLTKFALVIVHQYQIICHHPLLRSHFTTNWIPELNLIDIDVTDKTWMTGEQETANFALTRKYSFSTIHGRHIELDLKSLQRQSLNKLGRPPMHLNIIHSEQSATDFISGTRSDNVSIPKHWPTPSGESSGSNGHIPNTLLASNMNITVHVEPTPHYRSQRLTCDSSDSNGHIPGGTASSSGFITDDILFKNTDRPRFELPDTDSSFESEFIARGPNAEYNDNIVPLDSVQSQTNPKILVQARTSENTKSRPQGSVVHLPARISRQRLESESSPFPLGPEDTLPPPHICSEGFPSESMLGTMVTFLDDVDVSLLPPPTPCGGQTNPVTYISCWSFADDDKSVSEAVPLLPRRLFRSQSVRLLAESELPYHSYVNTEQLSGQLRNIHDDSPYYRFYYNYGFIRMMAARMSTKIRRYRRLSKDMKGLDVNLLDKHELWFDECFKTRDKDLRFCRLSRMNIPSQPTEDTGTGYSKPIVQESIPDDPYWNGDLCITLQAKLQKKIPNAQEVFDITQEQLLGILVLLSLVPSERNWKDLAEHIGLVSEDIGIVEHFCYTYRELTGEVVMAHWMMQCQRGKSSIACTRENLLQFLDEIGRNDIMNILLTTSDNVNVQTPGELEEITHF